MLYFSQKGEEKKLIKVPNDLDYGSSAEKVFCAKAKDNRKYVIVTYSSGATSCAKCHVDKVYSLDGIEIFPNEPWQKTWKSLGLPLGFTSLSIEGK